MQPDASRSSSPLGRRNAARGAVGAAVGCALAAILVNTWFVEGLFVPLVVSGGSMAPALLGAHRGWQCAACGQSFACNLESLPADGASAKCPHCGAANDAARGANAPGDRVLVDRSAFLWRPPRRWETVVVRSPEDPQMLCVKRVVGLPGEVVDIVEGDVRIDGDVTPKDLATLRAMAVTVSGLEATRRWQPENAAAWRLKDGWFVHDARADDSIAWLSYHHEEPALRGTRGAEQAILDASAYDQNESRLLNEVDDVILRLEIETSGSGFVHLRVACRGDDFRVSLDAASEAIELVHNGRPAGGSVAAGTPGDVVEMPARLELVVADHRVQCALGGRLVLEYDYEPQASAGEGGRVLAVGASGGKVRVRNLEVLRDVYYTTAAAGRGVQYRLGKGEYFLLGDNSPHSLDSRMWSTSGGVSGRLLVGPALVW